MNSSTVSAISKKRGASATISLFIPVRAVICNGISRSGFTSDVNLSITSPSFKSAMQISVILFPAIPPPVVSTSIIAKSCDCIFNYLKNKCRKSIFNIWNYSCKMEIIQFSVFKMFKCFREQKY